MANRSALLCGGAVAALALWAGGAQAQDSARVDIAPQSLASALNEFGVQTGRQVIYTPALASTKTTRGVTASGDIEAALARLLEGSGLTFRRNEDTFLIVQAGEGGSSPQDASAGDVDALIVTAQKKEEAIQDVPIAISAFTQKSLDAQKIEGGFDLLKAIPNVTFSKSNFSGYNFSIRGIGTKAVSATTDPAVAVAYNSSGLIVNRLFEQEYFDVQRVEVLRGPQGTLYGRNATSGVINVIPNKPRIGDFDGELKLEGGNYNAKRARGTINVPVGDTLALRVAGAMTRRDGYGLNLENGEDVDGRDLWSTRATLGWEPNERLRVDLGWERFHEDDNRVRTSKQLCHRDESPTEVAGVAVPGPLQPFLSQGCRAGSLYDAGAYGTPVGKSLAFVIGLTSIGGGNNIGFNPNPDPVNCPFDTGVVSLVNLCADPYAGVTQSSNLREIASLIEPKYRADSDLLDLTVDFDLTESLNFTSQTLYSKDEVYSTQDFNRFHTQPIFNDSAAACGVANLAVCNPGTYANFGLPTFAAGEMADVTPGGVFCDPQLGCSDRMVGQDISRASSRQFNQEFRLQSSFDGPVNFSVGANYTRFRTDNDYYVFFNMFTAIAQANWVFNGPGSRCASTGISCVYVDPNPLESINGEGHNYFRSKNPYRLTSVAAFGEFYWQATETVKMTAGLRFTWDRKIFTPHPSQTLLMDYRENSAAVPGVPPEACTVFTVLGGGCHLSGTGVGGRGYPAEPDVIQEWREPTGRLGLDWKPTLGFTDETMVYAVYSRGYKAGGANPPTISAPQGILNVRGREASASFTFEPEFVDAFELGSKNTLLGGALVLNAAAFYYDYKDYQVSKIVDRTANNENFDAEVWGLELEAIWSPSRNLRFNTALGLLDTKIGEGELSIDLMDRTQGNPDWVVIKPGLTSASNCIAPAVYVAQHITANPGLELTWFCPSGATISGESYWSTGYQPTFLPGTTQYLDELVDVPNAGAGFFADVSGNELPNAPHWTVSLGAQYRFALPGGWDGTARLDGYLQGQSFARVYNTQYDKLHGWGNVNLSLWVENPDWGVTAEVYVKNLTDETPITDAFLNSDDTALTTNVFTLDPRLVGVSVRKSF